MGSANAGSGTFTAVSGLPDVRGRLRPWVEHGLVTASDFGTYTFAGGALDPVAWQLTHRRPFAPRSWKNSLVRSMRPEVLNVDAKPVGLGNGRPLGSCRRSSASKFTGTAAEINKARLIPAAFVLMLISP